MEDADPHPPVYPDYITFPRVCKGFHARNGRENADSGVNPFLFYIFVLVMTKFPL